MGLFTAARSLRHPPAATPSFPLPPSPGHLVIRGLVQIRGVTRPLALRAALTRQTRDPAAHSEIADFVMRGSFN